MAELAKGKGIRRSLQLKEGGKNRSGQKYARKCFSFPYAWRKAKEKSYPGKTREKATQEGFKREVN